MKSQLDRELIERLNESTNPEFIKRINQTVFNLVEQVVEDISLKSPFVTLKQCVLIPANEVYLGSFCQLSEYSYILAIDNNQMETNTKLKSNWWKFVWREFRASWRLGKKKYKKKKNKQPTLDTLERYTLGDFRHDVVATMCNYLQESSIVYEFKNYITLNGKDDFGTGVRINIYFSCYDISTGNILFFKENKNKFQILNFGKRFVNLEEKKANCGEIFVSMVKIFNSIYSKAYNKIPNQILIESLLFNCPNNLFIKNDLYQTFVNISNFIRFKNPKNFKSICDESKTIFEEPLIVLANQQFNFGKVINMLDKFVY